MGKRGCEAKYHHSMSYLLENEFITASHKQIGEATDIVTTIVDQLGDKSIRKTSSKWLEISEICVCYETETSYE